MRFCIHYKMKLGGTTKLFVLLEQSNRTFLFALIAQSVEQRTENPCVAGSIPAQGTIILIKGGTIMEKLNLLISYKALTQVIVPVFTFGFFPAGR